MTILNRTTHTSRKFIAESLSQFGDPKNPPALSGPFLELYHSKLNELQSREACSPQNYYQLVDLLRGDLVEGMRRQGARVSIHGSTDEPYEVIIRASASTVEIRVIKGLLEYLEEGLQRKTESLVSEKSQQHRFTLLSAEAILESLTRVYGSNSVGIQITTQTSSPEEIRTLRAEDQRPLLVSSRWCRNLHGHAQLHPWVGFLHDMAHIVVLNRSSPLTRHDTYLVYEAISDIPPDILSRHLPHPEATLENLLDGSLANPPELYRMLRKVLEHASTKSAVPDQWIALLGDKLRQLLPPDHPRRSYILKEFQYACHLVREADHGLIRVE